MRKALQALENIKSLFVGSPIDLSQQFDIIETALKRLEVLDNIQSKPLEALKRLNEFRFEYEDYEMCETTDYMIVENALKHHEHNMTTIIPNLVKTTEEQSRVIEEHKKELKALEIIKKYINVDEDENGLHWLNLIGCASIGITQEEYDLLKEVLKK